MFTQFNLSSFLEFLVKLFSQIILEFFEFNTEELSAVFLMFLIN